MDGLANQEVATKIVLLLHGLQVTQTDQLSTQLAWPRACRSQSCGMIIMAAAMSTSSQDTLARDRLSESTLPCSLLRRF